MGDLTWSKEVRCPSCVLQGVDTWLTLKIDLNKPEMKDSSPCVVCKQRIYLESDARKVRIWYNRSKDMRCITEIDIRGGPAPAKTSEDAEEAAWDI